MDDAVKREAKVQRALLEAYILGVESRMRGKLTRPQRDELRYAWMAGFITGQSNTATEQR
jgi:hypothetical protein